MSTCSIVSAADSLIAEIDEHKRRQHALIDDLAQTISVYKEKSVDEAAEAHRQLEYEAHDRRYASLGVGGGLHAASGGAVLGIGGGDEGGSSRGSTSVSTNGLVVDFDDRVAEVARRFEVCFEDCMWRLTEARLAIRYEHI